jgi:hypothetical protein
MAAETERLVNVEMLRFDEPSRVETRSDSKRVGNEARLGHRIQTLGLVLESLWLFYEAMHSGKPLACGEERLAQLRAALKSAPGKS